MRVVVLPASWSWPSILVNDRICPEYPAPTSKRRFSSTGLSTRCIARMSRSMFGSTIASTTYARQRSFLSDKRGGAGVAPEIDVARKIEVEGGRHLRERPVREADGLVAPGEALGHASLHEERRRSEEDYVEAAALTPVRIP